MISQELQERINLLNVEQKEVFDYVIKSVLSPKKEDHKFERIKLESEPGTGKSFTISRIIEYLIEQDKEISLQCPTHTSKKIVENMLTDEILSSGKIEIRTVSSFLKKIPINDSYGETVFTNGYKMTDRYDLIIVDEFSMISKWDLEKICNSQSTVLLSGDENQLPPVKSKKIILDDWNKHLTEEFTLKTQMRFDNDSQIDKVVKITQDKVYFPKNSKGNITVHKKFLDWEQTFLEYLKDGLNPVCISYTNKESLRLGELGRTILLNDDQDPNYPFYPDETLRLCSNLNKDVKNGTIIQIDDVKTSSLHIVPNVKQYTITTCEGIVFETVDPNDIELVDKYVDSLKEQIDKLREINSPIGDLVEKIKNIRSSIVIVIRPWSLTSHKSQGSTIGHCFVNTSDIQGRSYQRNLLYVSYSRSQKTLHTIDVDVNKRKLIKDCISDFNNQFDVNITCPSTSIEHWKVKDVSDYIYTWYNILSGNTPLNQMGETQNTDNIPIPSLIGEYHFKVLSERL